MNEIFFGISDNQAEFTRQLKALSERDRQNLNRLLGLVPGVIIAGENEVARAYHEILDDTNFTAAPLSVLLDNLQDNVPLNLLQEGQADPEMIARARFAALQQIVRNRYGSLFA